MMANRSTMITTPAGTAIAMISVSVERGSLTGGGAEVGEEEEEEAAGEAAGEDVGEDVGEEEEEDGEVGVRQVGTLGSN